MSTAKISEFKSQMLTIEYCGVFEPRLNDLNNQVEYSATFSWPKSQGEVTKILTEKIAAAAVAGGLRGPWRNPIRDGDEPNTQGNPRYEGRWFVRAKAKADRPPRLFNAKMEDFKTWLSSQELLGIPANPDNFLCPGSTVYAVLYPHPYDKSGSKGVSLFLKAVQCVKINAGFERKDRSEAFFEAFPDGGLGTLPF